MFSHGHARRAVLLLMVLAAAVLWTAGQGVRAAANDRAEKSATPAKAATTAVTDTTATTPPPATTAKADTAATAAAEPAPATAAAAAPQKRQGQEQGHAGPGLRREVQADRAVRAEGGGKQAAKRGLKPGSRPDRDGRAAVQAPDPGGVPHYFGPYGNWAFSPLPKGAVDARHDCGQRVPGISATPTVDASTDAYLTIAPVTAADGDHIALQTVTSQRTASITGIHERITRHSAGTAAPVVDHR